jgi:hypothetical protein
VFKSIEFANTQTSDPAFRVLTTVRIDLRKAAGFVVVNQCIKKAGERNSGIGN